MKEKIENEDREFWKDVYVAAIAAEAKGEQATDAARRALADLHVEEKDRGWTNERI